jgi:hypothetical protein
VFSGPNYNSSGAPLTIKSSRLKLRNNNFPYNSVNYQILLPSPEITLYFTPNYLGNPANYTGWTEDQILFSDTYDHWLLANNGGYGYGTDNNFHNSFMQISRLPDTPNLESTSYFVVCPAYFKFTQTGTFVAETNLPYNPSVNASANVVHRYLPIVNRTYPVGDEDFPSYFPFTTRTFEYITGETVTVECDSEHTNNAGFVYTFTYEDRDKKIYDFIEHPIYTKYEIIVTGNNYNISAYLGKSDSANPIFIKTLFEGTASELLNLPTDLNNGDLTLVSSLNTNSGVRVSYLQSLLSYNNNTLTISEIFANPDVTAITNNVCFDIDSFFLHIDNGYTKLDLTILQGIEVSMYTKKLSMDSSGNMFVNVYKYPPVSNGLTKSTQVTTLFYNYREVKSIPVPSISIQDSEVPIWNNIVKSISYDTTSSTSWEPDDTFNNSGTILFASLVNLTRQAISTTEPLLFACETNGIKKITLINKQPLLKILNKVGMPILEIDANGVIKTPVLSTNSLILNPLSVLSINSSLSDYPLYSVLGNVTDNVV